MFQGGFLILPIVMVIVAVLFTVFGIGAMFVGISDWLDGSKKRKERQKVLAEKVAGFLSNHQGGDQPPPPKMLAK